MLCTQPRAKKATETTALEYLLITIVSTCELDCTAAPQRNEDSPANHWRRLLPFSVHEDRIAQTTVAVINNELTYVQSTRAQPVTTHFECGSDN